MNDIFREWLDNFVIVYIDDILMYSSSLEEHAEHFHKVFHRLRENKLYAKPEKCEFGVTEVDFLGHRITQEGLMMDDHKVKVILDWEPPKRQEEGKNHGYTWEFFKERLESEFVPRNSDYISRCKLWDLVNAINENLRQYVRAYSELMLEVRHMHEMDRVCQFVMGLPTWAKRKLEESWPASLSEAITKVENFSDVGRSDKSGFKKDNKFFHKKSRHEGEWNRGQGSPTKDKPKTFHGSGFKPKGSFVKKGAPFKGSQPKGDFG
jgi:hypothetical protein